MLHFLSLRKAVLPDHLQIFLISFHACLNSVGVLSCSVLPFSDMFFVVGIVCFTYCCCNSHISVLKKNIVCVQQLFF